MSNLERQSYIDEIDRLKQLVDSLTLTINNQSSTINELTAEIAALKETIKELISQKNKDSHNSSKPPSSDGYKKPSPKSQREKTGKPKGGQKGHAGNHMSIPHEPDDVIDHHPVKEIVCHDTPFRWAHHHRGWICMLHPFVASPYGKTWSSLEKQHQS